MTSRGLRQLLLACALLVTAALQAALARDMPARADFGRAQLAAIQARYAHAADDCGAPTRPAVLCSGVLIRITGSGNGYHVWNPSSGSVTRGGVSFSYLRTDTNFAGMVWTDLDGFIFSPPSEPDAATVHPVTMCAFPLDAHSSARPDRGCGQYSSVVASRPCQSQGIFTAAAWLNHFVTVGNSQHPNQCGFTTTPDEPTAAAGFLASLRARPLLDASKFQVHNELLLATWLQDIGASLPLEAFYYLIEDGRSGLAGAQRNQRDLLNTDGVAVPVIHVTLPVNATGPAVFAFKPADQVIEAPALPAAFALAPSVPLAPLGALRLQDVLDHASIEVLVPPAPGIVTGDVGRVRWTGKDTLFETASQPLSAGSFTTFSVPRGDVLATLGQSVAVSFIVTSHAPAAIERVSAVREVTVQAQAMSLPRPIVAADHRYVTIDYPGMAAGDRVRMTYDGTTSHEVPHLVHDVGAFALGLPPDWLAGAPGRIRYDVQPAGQSGRFMSPDVVVGRRPLPMLREAANGWLDLADLATDPAVVLAPWEGIALGGSVWLDAIAYAPDGTGLRARLLDGAVVSDIVLRDGVTATLPREWLRQLPDGSAVFLRARAVVRGNDPATALAFPVARFTLRGAPGPILTKPLPRVVDVRGDGSVVPLEGAVFRHTVAGQLQVRMPPWPGMRAGQHVWLSVHGRRTDGSAAEIVLADGYTLVQADLTQGLVKVVPPDELDAFADGSPFDVELKVQFEFAGKPVNEAAALAFPVHHLAYGD